MSEYSTAAVILAARDWQGPWPLTEDWSLEWKESIQRTTNLLLGGRGDATPPQIPPKLFAAVKHLKQLARRRHTTPTRLGYWPEDIRAAAVFYQGTAEAEAS